MKFKRVLTGIVAFVMMVLVTVPAFAYANPVGRCGTCGKTQGARYSTSATYRDCNGGSRHYTTVTTWKCHNDGDYYDTIKEKCAWCF